MLDAIGAADYVDRTVEVVVENRSGLKLSLGGEWFEHGGWAIKRQQEIGADQKITLRFQNSNWVFGCDGYVSFHSQDHSRTLFLSFSNPMTGEARFTARGGKVVSMKDVFTSMPVVDEQQPRIADGCAFQRMSNTDGGIGKLIMAVVMLPDDLKKLPANISKWMEKGKPCESDVAKQANGGDRDEAAMLEGSITQRYFTVEVDNQSEETFIPDGELFEAGGWWKNVKLQSIAAKSKVVLYLHSEDVMYGLCGVFWFVNSSTLDIYFSVALKNPLAGESSFWASAGAPPEDLLVKFESGPIGDPTKSRRVRDSACYWKWPDATTCRVLVTIEPKLARMDLSAYGRTNEEKEAAAAPKEPEPPKLSSETALAVVQDSKSEEDQAVEALNQLWDQSRPKDALDGLGQGFKAVGGGLLAGLASMVAAPVVGASEDGVSGFAKGVATGVMGAVVCTVGGAVMGATQVARGVMNTPDAMMQTGNKVWDPQKGCWVDDTVHLRSEIDEVLAQESSDESGDEGKSEPASSSSSRPAKVVVDRDFYDQLGVDPDANPSEIKKAYYKAALKVHPDKNQDDPAAHQKFQDLAKAYQVLSDPALRAKYDKQGKQAVNSEEPAFNPELFFGMLFGSEKFEKYVGKMYLGTQVKKVFKSRADEGEDTIRLNSAENANDDRRQRRREVKLAKYMCEKLDQVVIQRDEAGFVEATMREGVELLKVSFGVQMLRTLGETYEDCGLGFFERSAMARYRREWRDSAYRTSQGFTVFGSVVKSLVAARNISKEVEGDQPPSMASLEGSLPVFLQTAWEMSKMDVESTAKAVCAKLTKDISVPWQIRVRRANALQLLGRIFTECSQVGSFEDSDPEVAKRQLEEALLGMAMKTNMKGEEQ